MNKDTKTLILFKKNTLVQILFLEDLHFRQQNAGPINNGCLHPENLLILGCLLLHPITCVGIQFGQQNDWTRKRKCKPDFEEPLILSKKGNNINAYLHEIRVIWAALIRVVMKNRAKQTFRQIRYDDKKNQILESATRLFYKKSYEGTTMEDVSNELLMTKGSLYSYVKSKQDMLFQCHMKTLEMASRVLMETLNSDLTPKMKLQKAIVRHIEHMTKEFAVGTLRQQEFLLPKHMREKVIKKRDEFEKFFFKILKGAIENGHIRTDNMKIKIVGYAILGAMNWVPRWYSAEGSLSPTQIGEIIADYLTGKIEKKVRR